GTDDMNGRHDPRPRGLYLITPDEPDTARLLERVGRVIDQATWLQYRNKAAAPALRHEQAAALTALCARAGVPLIINDDPALARGCAAGGVHLGEDDGDVAAARELLGDAAITGASCYDDIGRAARMAAAARITLPSARFSRPTARRGPAARNPTCCAKPARWACRGWRSAASTPTMPGRWWPPAPTCWR